MEALMGVSIWRTPSSDRLRAADVLESDAARDRLRAAEVLASADASGCSIDGSSSQTIGSRYRVMTALELLWPHARAARRRAIFCRRVCPLES
eukprot:7390624-Prymnesium_polylepis.1